MHRYIAVVATLVMTSTLAGVGAWATGPQGSPAKPMKLWGSVVSFDSTKNKLTIKDRHGRIHELQVESDSQFTKGGRNEKIAGKDLKAGVSVAVVADGIAAKSVHWNVNAAKVGNIAKAKKG